MDTASSLIGLGLLLLFIGPIFILILQQHKKEKNTLKLIRAIITDSNLNPEIIELSETPILALDSNAQKLLIFNPGKIPEFGILELVEVKESYLFTQTLKNSDSSLKYISLMLFGEKSSKIDEIVFYDEDDKNATDAQVSLVRAKKWVNLISVPIRN